MLNSSYSNFALIANESYDFTKGKISIIAINALSENLCSFLLSVMTKSIVVQLVSKIKPSTSITMKVIELGFELTKKFEKVLIPIGTKIAVEIMLPSCQINELTTIADIKEARGIFRLLKYQYVAISPPIDLGVMVCTTIPIIVPTKISLHLTLSPCSVITRLKIRA